VENGDFGEDPAHQLGLAASIGFGKVWPGVQMRLPLDKDLKETWDFAAGIHLGIRLE